LALEEFREISGLALNPNKSEIFFAAVPGDIKAQILACLQFKEGYLPVRYLGMPLISGKLTYKDCLPLIDKIVGRIHTWSAKHLSFAGRLQLIQSILFSIQMYWSSIFILPKKVIKAIEHHFNHYLWQGKSTGRGGIRVAWDKVCLPKREGGLGLKSVEDWNRAAVLKHIWSLFTQSGSLWVAWIHRHLIKDKCFWTIKKTSDCTWGWRTMLKLREYARFFLKYEVGDGTKIFLWHDYWHPDGILYLKYGHKTVYDVASRIDARVASVLKDKEWHWRPARSKEMVSIQSKLGLIDLRVEDRAVWTASKSGV
jgi:hypothetical protein